MSTPVNSCFVSADAAKTMSIEELFEELQSSNHGLGSIAAASRLASCGPNLLKEKKRSALLKFLRYFWGPIPWMIELAGILSAILHHWPNFIIILVLLLVNGLVGFFEEHQAGNAIEALKKKLALKSLVKRDGNWSEIEAAEIVPGDIVRVRLGNIIPADLRLLDGDYLIVDQSTLTGESLPVSKKIGDIAYSGSIAKQGEVEALVISTGQNTFFGKTAKLVEEAGSVSHFQRAVLAIGNYLITKVNPKPKVVIGYDTRFHSKAFGETVARVLNKMGCDVIIGRLAMKSVAGELVTLLIPLVITTV